MTVPVPPPKGKKPFSFPYFFGLSQNLDKKDVRNYEELLAKIASAVNPGDIFEEMWVGDIANLSWDILQLRRIKQHLPKTARHDALVEILKSIENTLDPTRGMFSDTHQLVLDFNRRSPDAIKRVKDLLFAGKLTMDDVNARAFEKKIEPISRIDFLIANAEARRNTALREIDRHRGSSLKLRDALREAEDAEFEIIDVALKDTKKLQSHG